MSYSLGFFFTPILGAAFLSMTGFCFDAAYFVLHFAEPPTISLGIVGLVAGFGIGLIVQLWVVFTNSLGRGA